MTGHVGKLEDRVVVVSSSRLEEGCHTIGIDSAADGGTCSRHLLTILVVITTQVGIMLGSVALSMALPALLRMMFPILLI